MTSLCSRTLCCGNSSLRWCIWQAISKNSAFPLTVALPVELTAALLRCLSPNWRACMPWNLRRENTHLAGAFLQSILPCDHTMANGTPLSIMLNAVLDGSTSSAT